MECVDFVNNPFHTCNRNGVWTYQVSFVDSLHMLVTFTCGSHKLHSNKHYLSKISHNEFHIASDLRSNKTWITNWRFVHFSFRFTLHIQYNQALREFKHCRQPNIEAIQAISTFMQFKHTRQPIIGTFQSIPTSWTCKYCGNSHISCLKFQKCAKPKKPGTILTIHANNSRKQFTQANITNNSHNSMRNPIKANATKSEYISK